MIAESVTLKIVEFPKRKLAYVRHVGPFMGNEELFENLFKEVMEWAGPEGHMTIPDMEAISIYHDDPETVPQGKQRISVGFTVPISIEHATGNIQIMEIPAGKYALGHFSIKPNEYGEAWEEMMHFIAEENLSMADGPMYESYKNDPRTHPEGLHLVDICVALMEN
jgi:AraC family transcriptional regulator